MEHLWSQVIVPGDVMVPSPPPAPGAGSGPSYQAVIDSVPDALLLVTEDGTISLVNAAAERMFGYTRDQLVGQDHRILLAEGFREGFRKLFNSLRRDAGISMNVSVRGTSHGGGGCRPARGDVPVERHAGIHCGRDPGGQHRWADRRNQ
ncbi:PAS domain S-box protein [Micrococcaceae bacterium Sec5.7]